VGRLIAWLQRWWSSRSAPQNGLAGAPELKDTRPGKWPETPAILARRTAALPIDPSDRLPRLPSDAKRNPDEGVTDV
jgi:hypothetical protein